jgi:hypothetical protein
MIEQLSAVVIATLPFLMQIIIMLIRKIVMDDGYIKEDLFSASRFKYSQARLTAQPIMNNVFNERFYYLRSASINLFSEPARLQATLKTDF